MQGGGAGGEGERDRGRALKRKHTWPPTLLLLLPPPPPPPNARHRCRPPRRVSHLSHVGGLLGGLFTSLMFLPNLKDRRFKAVRRFVKTHWGTRLPRNAPREHRSCWSRNRCLHIMVLALCAMVVLFLFVGLPVWVWVWKLPRLACPAAPGLV
jgi:hypothetical protein